ncbi:MAG: hypothetical protein ACI9G1_002453 [Pirellulaceae bacterium]|jgi:hypothetical protein
MGRRKKGKGDVVSLFPFLSILACVIGVLTLIISALAVAQMDTPELASVEALETAEKQRSADLNKIAALEKKIAELRETSSDIQKESVDKLNRVKQLKLAVDNAIIENSQPKPAAKLPVADEDKHKLKVEQLLKEIADAAAEIKKAATEIASKKTPPAEAVVQVRPSGSGAKLKPTFIECTAAGLVLFSGPQPVRVRRADIATNADLIAILKKIADAKDETIIFLIRDDAVRTYDLARKVALDNYARNGKLPVIGKGKLDLSVFKD